MSFTVGIYLFKLKYKNTRKRCEISPKLTKNPPKKVVYKIYPIQISIYHLVRKVGDFSGSDADSDAEL